MSHHIKCADCPRFIPDDKRSDSLFCSKKCQVRVHQRRVRAKKASEWRETTGTSAAQIIIDN